MAGETEPQEFSYPVEEEPMPAKDWSSVTLGIGSGVLDEGGAPYRLINVNNASNTVTVAIDSITKYSHAILRGFYHKITANQVLDIPAVTSTTTYRIALQYDPERNSAGQLPVILGVFTSLDYTGGKDYHVLHTIVRQPNQLLTDAVRTKTDVKVTPQLLVDEYASLPPADSVLYGTTVLVRLPFEVLYQSRGDPGARTWRKLTEYNNLPADERFDWTLRGSTATYVSPVAGGYTRALGRRGKQRKLRGRVSLASGNDMTPGNTYSPWSGTLDTDDRPSQACSFTTTVAGSSPVGFARVEIGSDGSVTAWVSKAAAWLSFDGVEWEAR